MVYHMCNVQAINTSEIFHPSKTVTSSAFVQWKGRIVRIIEYIGSKLADLLAWLLHGLAAKAVVYSTSKQFKAKLDPVRIEKTRNHFKDFGGQEITLPTADGHQISAMYFDAKKSVETLISLGAIVDNLQLDNENAQRILWIPRTAEKLRDLIDGMGLTIENHEDREYISIATSENSEGVEGALPVPRSAVIYAHGSGHIFEVRRRTISVFTLKFGMNIICFNYSGSGKSTGQITEKAMYANIDAIYQFVKNKGFDDHRILSYGHCVGSGPATDLASRHPEMSLIADRALVSMAEFAPLRACTKIRIPKPLRHFLTAWIKPVMQRCFHFNNVEKIQKVQGGVATVLASKDHLIPSSYAPRLFENAKSAKVRMFLTQNSNHDIDIAQDKETQTQLRVFLQQAELI